MGVRNDDSPKGRVGKTSRSGRKIRHLEFQSLSTTILYQLIHHTLLKKLNMEQPTPDSSCVARLAPERFARLTPDTTIGGI